MIAQAGISISNPELVIIFASSNSIHISAAPLQPRRKFVGYGFGRGSAAGISSGSGRDQSPNLGICWRSTCLLAPAHRISILLARSSFGFLLLLARSWFESP